MYDISANGVYRCCKYLKNITFYDDENGWTYEAEEMKQFSYKKILKFLIDNYESRELSGIKYYDGDELWEKFFLTNTFLSRRIRHWGITSLSQLHFYANEKANGR